LNVRHVVPLARELDESFALCIGKKCARLRFETGNNFRRRWRSRIDESRIQSASQFAAHESSGDRGAENQKPASARLWITPGGMSADKAEALKYLAKSSG